MGLGDHVAQALALAGVTEERAHRWLGACCCRERRERLNQLGWAAQSILRGKILDAKKYLAGIMGDEGAQS